MKSSFIFIILILIFFNSCTCIENIPQNDNTKNSIYQEFSEQTEETTKQKIEESTAHTHMLVNYIRQCPTCSEYGVFVTECSLCHKIISEQLIDKLEHTPGDLVIEQEATVTQDQISRIRCTECGQILFEESKSYNQIIAAECLLSNFSGRIVVPSLGINTPFTIISKDSYDYKLAQALVDQEDMSCMFFINSLGSWFLADHKSHGFYKFYDAVPQITVAYLVFPTYTNQYLCKLSMEGLNYGGIVIPKSEEEQQDSGWNYIQIGQLYPSEDYNDRFIVYTCMPEDQNGRYIWICVFDKED